MRRKTKPRVVWLPPDPNNRVSFAGAGGEITTTDAAIPGRASLGLAAGAPGTFNGKIVPVVGDHTQAGDYIIGSTQDSHTFADLFSNGYRLRRICGHIWPFLVQRPGNVGTNYVVTCGFQVMSVNESGLPANGEEGVIDSYATQENPWIWRRSWVLTNYASDTAVAGGATYGEAGPSQGGFSVREGSIVDQKTARRIGPDQRLFMCWQATLIDVAAEEGGVLELFWNYRVLASLLTVPAGNRRNSTR